MVWLCPTQASNDANEENAWRTVEPTMFSCLQNRMHGGLWRPLTYQIQEDSEDCHLWKIKSIGCCQLSNLRLWNGQSVMFIIWQPISCPYIRQHLMNLVSYRCLIFKVLLCWVGFICPWRCIMCPNLRCNRGLFAAETVDAPDLYNGGELPCSGILGVSCVLRCWFLDPFVGDPNHLKPYYGRNFFCIGSCQPFNHRP